MKTVSEYTESFCSSSFFSSRWLWKMKYYQEQHTSYFTEKPSADKILCAANFGWPWMTFITLSLLVFALCKLWRVSWGNGAGELYALKHEDGSQIDARFCHFVFVVFWCALINQVFLLRSVSNWTKLNGNLKWNKNALV